MGHLDLEFYRVLVTKNINLSTVDYTIMKIVPLVLHRKVQIPPPCLSKFKTVNIGQKYLLATKGLVDFSNMISEQYGSHGHCL